MKINMKIKLVTALRDYVSLALYINKTRAFSTENSNNLNPAGLFHNADSVNKVEENRGKIEAPPGS
jgi:hypothetical protein